MVVESEGYFQRVMKPNFATAARSEKIFHGPVLYHHQLEMKGLIAISFLEIFAILTIKIMKLLANHNFEIHQ